MAYRQLRVKEVIKLEESAESGLTAEQVTAYLRQSSTAQVLQNTESADLQLSGAQRYAISLGLDSDKIVIAHEGGGKRGVSGTLRIEEREELRDLVADIDAGTTKRVWAYSVSRLFRDKYGVQVATFIKMCAEHGVTVKIENAGTLFDFSNNMHVFMFQFLANVAARENEDRSVLLHEANARRSRRGLYDGRPLVVGFIVDRTKLLPDGRPNPTYGKFKPYETHARVIRWLYGRYRELGGRFNLLASEVSKMPIVFDDFEPGIDKRDIHKLRLKKVSGGYHITKHGLFGLMTAVEYAGYWKFKGEVLTDSQGTPVCNHEAIVDDELWQYAFLNLSHTTLTGEKNTARLETRVTWNAATVKGEAREETGGYLLREALSSPLGTIVSGSEQYRVTAKRIEHGVRTNTLTIDAGMLDTVFMRRLMERLPDIDRKTLLEDSLRETRERNKKALISVDRQIGQYRREIAGIEAFIKTIGASAPRETLENYNAQLIDGYANLNALVAKKQAAGVEESDLEKLLELMQQVCDTCWQLTGEQTRRYIKLATEKVVIDEYSSHYLLLTVTWCEPFGQTDIAYIHREDGGHQQWCEEDKADLARLYPYADRLELLQRWPIRTWADMRTLASRLRIERNTRLNTSGITDRSLSLADKTLMETNGWATIEHVRWLCDVMVKKDDLSSSSYHPAQVTVLYWLSELRSILARAA